MAAEHLPKKQKIRCTWSSPKMVVALCPSSKITWWSNLQRAQLRPSQPSKAIPRSLLHLVWAGRPWAETKPYRKIDGPVGQIPWGSALLRLYTKMYSSEHAPWSLLWRSRSAPEKSFGLFVVPKFLLVCCTRMSWTARWTKASLCDGRCQPIDAKWLNSDLSIGGQHLRRKAIRFLGVFFPVTKGLNTSSWVHILRSSWVLCFLKQARKSAWPKDPPAPSGCKHLMNHRLRLSHLK